MTESQEFKTFGTHTEHQERADEEQQAADRQHERRRNLDERQLRVQAHKGHLEVEASKLSVQIVQVDTDEEDERHHDEQKAGRRVPSRQQEHSANKQEHRCQEVPDGVHILALVADLSRTVSASRAR